MQTKLNEIVQKRLNLDPVEDLADDARACIVSPEGLRQAIQEAYDLGRAEAAAPAKTTS